MIVILRAAAQNQRVIAVCRVFVKQRIVQPACAILSAETHLEGLLHAFAAVVAVNFQPTVYTEGCCAILDQGDVGRSLQRAVAVISVDTIGAKQRPRLGRYHQQRQVVIGQPHGILSRGNGRGQAIRLIGNGAHGGGLADGQHFALIVRAGAAGRAAIGGIVDFPLAQQSNLHGVCVYACGQIHAGGLRHAAQAFFIFAADGGRIVIAIPSLPYAVALICAQSGHGQRVNDLTLQIKQIQRFAGCAQAEVGLTATSARGVNHIACARGQLRIGQPPTARFLAAVS